MYPAVSHKNPSQKVSSSQVFERWIFQKQQKIINKMTKSSDQNTIEGLEQLCPKRNHDFLCWMLTSETQSHRLLVSSWSVICLLCSISQNWTLRKRLNDFERFKFVDTDKTFRKANFTTISGTFSSKQTLLLAICTLKEDLVSEWVTRADPQFFINETLNSGTVMINQTFHFLI